MATSTTLSTLQRSLRDLGFSEGKHGIWHWICRIAVPIVDNERIGGERIDYEVASVILHLRKNPPELYAAGSYPQGFGVAKEKANEVWDLLSKDNPRKPR